MNIEEMKSRISMELPSPLAQQGFEVICKQLAEKDKQIAKMRNCGNCVNICNGRRNDRCIGCGKRAHFPHWEWDAQQETGK